MAALALLAACGRGTSRPAPDVPVGPFALPPHARVMVFAPHPDDETIGVGGLIHALVRRRVPLRVVFVTNGDGYPRALEQAFVTHPTEDDYLALGERRQQEALAATRHLGLRHTDLRFLGFPDNGLEALWQAHWSRAHPYTSPYTNEDSPPYRDTVNPDADYDGQDLLSVLARVIREFRPTVVIMPHPYDRHADHAHTSYFVTEAVTSLSDRHVLPRRPMLLTYLVHYPNWPASRAPQWDRIYPLGTVADTRWLDLELSPADLDAKRAALAEYQTQLGAMRDFLRSFLCHNELLATVDGSLLARIASVH